MMTPQGIGFEILLLTGAAVKNPLRKPGSPLTRIPYNPHINEHRHMHAYICIPTNASTVYIGICYEYVDIV